MKVYRIACYNHDGFAPVNTITKEFYNDSAAVLYAFELRDDYFNVVVFRCIDSGVFIRVAKLY